MPIFPVVMMNPDKTFGPTKEHHYYLPVFYHNPTASFNPKKTRWSLKQNEQYHVFKIADEGKWACSKESGLFSVLDQGACVLGKSGEVLGFFPKPINSTDPWHGFPVTSDDKRPSSELLDIWIRDKVIGHATRIRIERGQI